MLTKEDYDKVEAWLQSIKFTNGHADYMYAVTHNGYPPDYEPGDKLDPVDQRYYNLATAKFAMLEGPRIGDIVVLKDGRYMRIGRLRDHDNRYQLCTAGFYLNKSGRLTDQSGSFYETFSADALRPTGETRKVLAWFAHHDHLTAGSAVYVLVECRVYELDIVSWAVDAPMFQVLNSAK